MKTIPQGVVIPGGDIELLDKLLLPAPTAEELRALIALGPGEEQDKLWTKMTKEQANKGLKKFVDEQQATHDATCAHCNPKLAGGLN